MRSIDIQNARINTAGAYVCIRGCYLFAIGIQPHNGHIPIVRLGGHREENETGWQCAVREVDEESNLKIRPLVTQTTYLADWDHGESVLQEIRWQPQIKQEPIPLLVLVYRSADSMHLSLMYLAHAKEAPRPSSEVKGLLLLTSEEIHHLCYQPMTLEQYLVRGGKAILNAEFDTSRILEPFVQFRLLSRILSLQSGAKA